MGKARGFVSACDGFNKGNLVNFPYLMRLTIYNLKGRRLERQHRTAERFRKTAEKIQAAKIMFMCRGLFTSVKLQQFCGVLKSWSPH